MYCLTAKVYNETEANDVVYSVIHSKRVTLKRKRLAGLAYLFDKQTITAFLKGSSPVYKSGLIIL
jgi:hypothetical protein